MKETILNYVQKKSGCKMASLDAKKAFDYLWRDGLFEKLMTKLHISYWTLLKTFYDSSLGFIEGNSETTLILILINIGVKQGGILSPYFLSA
jgi:hypothetical protein